MRENDVDQRINIWNAFPCICLVVYVVVRVDYTVGSISNGINTMVLWCNVFLFYMATI